MNQWSGILAVIGVVGLLVGIFGAIGTIPGLAVTCPTTAIVGGSTALPRCGGTPEITAYLPVAPGTTGANVTISGAYYPSGMTQPVVSLSIDSASVALTATTKVNSVDAYTNGPAFYTLSPGNHTAKATATSSYLGTKYSATSESIAFIVGSNSRCQINCNTTKWSITPAFKYTSTSAGVLTVIDTSTVSGVTGVTFAWTFGDGSTGSGSNATHTYAASGGYTVTDKVTGTTYLGVATASASHVVNITVGTTTPNNQTCGTPTTPICVSTGPPPPAPSVEPFNAATGLLIIGFGGLFVAAIIPGNPEWRAILAIVALVVGFGAGYFVGGLGPL